MRIEIRSSGNVPAVIIAFHTHSDRFDSGYERSKFFRELHGWRQTVPRNGKRYVYLRKGVLGEVPHIKVSDSTFIVPAREAKMLLEYFDEWADKVEYEMVEIMMKQGELMKRLAQEMQDEL